MPLLFPGPLVQSGRQISNLSTIRSYGLVLLSNLVHKLVSTMHNLNIKLHECMRTATHHECQSTCMMHVIVWFAALPSL